MDLILCKKCKYFLGCSDSLVVCKRKGYIMHWDIHETLHNTREVVLCPLDSF